MNRVVLITGGNLGDVAENMESVRRMISESVGEIEIMSPVMESEPWGDVNAAGGEPVQNFLNQVLVVETHLEPLEVLDELQSMENKLGRARKKDYAQEKKNKKYDSRTMDIDILFYNDQIYNFERLIIPHPLIGEREFVLKPLCSIMADFIHPQNGKTIRQMLKDITR